MAMTSDYFKLHARVAAALDEFCTTRHVWFQIWVRNGPYDDAYIRALAAAIDDAARVYVDTEVPENRPRWESDRRSGLAVDVTVHPRERTLWGDPDLPVVLYRYPSVAA